MPVVSTTKANNKGKKAQSDFAVEEESNEEDGSEEETEESNEESKAAKSESAKKQKAATRASRRKQPKDLDELLLVLRNTYHLEPELMEFTNFPEVMASKIKDQGQLKEIEELYNDDDVPIDVVLERTSDIM